MRLTENCILFTHVFLFVHCVKTFKKADEGKKKIGKRSKPEKNLDFYFAVFTCHYHTPDFENVYI